MVTNEGLLALVFHKLSAYYERSYTTFLVVMVFHVLRQILGGLLVLDYLHRLRKTDERTANKSFATMRTNTTKH